MKKRGLLLLLLGLIIAPNSLAIFVEELYQGTVLNTQTINISGNEFTFNILDESNTVYISWEGSSLSIPGYLNETNKTTETNCDEKDNLYFCVGKISFSHVNTTTKIRYYSVPVEISKIITEVFMLREIDNTDLLIGQQFTVKALLENRGTIEAKSIEYKDYFPSDFGINLADVKGCTINAGNIIFKGTLGINGKKECTYTLTALKGISYISKASLSYFNGNEKITENSGEITIKVANLSLTLNAELNKSSAEIGDAVQLLIALENTNSENDIDLTLELEIPSRLEITKKTKALEKTGSNLKFKGDVLQGESKNLTVDFRASYFGEFKLRLSAGYTIAGLKRKLNKEIALNVVKPELEINVDVPEEFEQGKESKIRIKIVNPTDKILFNDLNIKTKNNLNLSNVDKVINKLDKSSSILVLDTGFVLPSFDEDFYYNITLTYKTENGQIIVTKKSIPLKLKAAPSKENSYGESGQTVAEEKSAESQEIQESPAKMDIIEYDEEKKSVYDLFKSMFIKLFIVIAILLVVFLIIKFRKKLREQELRLKKEEEIKKEERTGLEETDVAQKEEKTEIKQPVEEPRTREQDIKPSNPHEGDLSVPKPPPEEKHQ